MKYSNILSRLDGSVWEIEPEKLRSIGSFLKAKISLGQLPREEIDEAAAARRVTRQSKTGRVAVLPVFGTLIQRAGFMEQMSGATDVSDLSRQFDGFMADSEISTIVLQVDSPGGVVFGIKEFADKIFAARDSKRIVAVADGYMASAAYKIGSAASEVFVSPSSLTGSIGVYQLHIDTSEADAMEGLKISLISAGKYKVEGNPFEPLSDEARTAMQSEVNAFYGDFTNDVARNRGVRTSEVRNGFGEGRVLTAAKAVSEGLADKVATFEEVLQSLVPSGGSNNSSRKRARADVERRRLALRKK